MATMTWGVRSSLTRYVTGLARGSVHLGDGAYERDAGFVFPSADLGQPLAFRGSVEFVGHGGLLRILIQHPAIEHLEGTHFVLTTRVDDEQRLPVAWIEQIAEDETGRAVAGRTVLLPEAVDLFGGQYPAGTLLDSPSVDLTHQV